MVIPKLLFCRSAGIRTLGPLIKSQLLYQLSYRPHWLKFSKAVRPCQAIFGLIFRRSTVVEQKSHPLGGWLLFYREFLSN